MTTVGTREDAVTTREDASTSRSTVKDASWMRDDVGGANEGLFERCRGAARALERAAHGAVSHREKCSALWGQAEATMLALREVENVYAMYDDGGRVQVKRQCVSVLGRLHHGKTLAEVYGSFTTAQKLVRYAIGGKTDGKFEEVTRDLDALELQLWNMAGASGRLGVAGVSSDGRRRLLRGGVAQTIDSIFGSGVLTMCAAGSDGAELWWSTGGAFPRLDAYDMFIRGRRRIESPRVDATGGTSCMARPSGGTSSAFLKSSIVTMVNAPNGSPLLWAGLKNGGVMAWDCDMGRLMNSQIVVVARNESVTAIAPIDGTRAWIGCTDGTVVELRVVASTNDSAGEFKVARDVVAASATHRPSFPDPDSIRKKSKSVSCMLHNASDGSEGVVFIACENDLVLEVWDVAEAKCVRMVSLEDLGSAVALMQHPTVRDLIVSVHDTGAVQIWGGDKCAVETGERVMNITMGFKAVDAWSLSKYFGKSIVGAVAVETIIAIGHANGKLTVWPLPGAHELHEASLHAETLASSKNASPFELRSSKLVAHGSGLVHLTKIDGGGSIGVITVGRFGSIMYWPLSQLEAMLGKLRQTARKEHSRLGLGSPSKVMNDSKFIPVNRTPESATLSETARIAYDHIKLEQKIGEGSFGRVFKATWNHIDVAVKFIGAQDIDVTSSGLIHSLEELEKEVSIMTKLRHPNIVLLLGVVMTPRPAIVQEFCVRGSLYAVLQRHIKPGAPELPWRIRLQMALGAAAGMLYLHDASVLHRDLKSANLMVDRYYRVKVGDFNLSRVHNDIVASGEGAERSGTLHSPRWMAPEVLTDGQYGTASDVYSFAIVMWELQSLQAPFKDLHVYQIVSIVPDGDRPEVDATHGAAFLDAESYRALMQRAWQSDPSLRPSFEDIFQEVQTLLDAQVAREQRAKRGVDNMPANNTGLPTLPLERTRSSSSSSGRKGSFKARRETVVKLDFDGKSPNEGDDSVVVETPAASPEKSSESALKETTNVLEVGDMDTRAILLNMRARGSLRESMRR